MTAFVLNLTIIQGPEIPPAKPSPKHEQAEEYAKAPAPNLLAPLAAQAQARRMAIERRR